MEEASRTGDDGSRSKLRFMYFHQKIKVREGVFAILELASKEFSFVRGEDGFVFLEPIFKLFAKTVGFAFGMGSRQGPVGGGVCQVFIQGPLNVGGTFNDGRAEVLVAGHNNQFVILLSTAQGVALRAKEIVMGASAGEERSDCGCESLEPTDQNRMQ